MKFKDKLLEFFGTEPEELDERELEDEYQQKQFKVQKTTYTQPEVEQQQIEEKEKKVMSIFGTNKKEEGGRNKVSHVSIIRPKTFDDSRLIADSIKDRKVVTFSLEFLEFEVGQRVIDFVSGAAYAMDAHLSKVTDKVLTSIPYGIGYEDIDNSTENDKL